MNIYKKIFHLGILAILYFCTLYLNSSIPFLQATSMHLVHWEGGFAQSIANHSLFYPYATNFGLPFPAPISFGLSAVWPMSVLIRLGIPIVDSYTLINALWLLVAFYGAYSLARYFGNNFIISGLGASLWLCLPLVRCHQGGYGALALGFALLPWYFYSALIFFFPKRDALFSTSQKNTNVCKNVKRIEFNKANHNSKRVIKKILFLFFTSLTSIFMDGYSFVLFFMSAIFIWIFAVYSYGLTKKIVAPTLIYFTCFICSAVMYKLYAYGLPLPHFSSSFLATFGLDIKLWLMPLRGLFALADYFNLSASIGNKPYWGDLSKSYVFALPLILSGIWGLWRLHKQKFAYLLICLGIIAFWLALGPIVKYDDLIPPDLVGKGSLLQWEKTDNLRTGNAWVCKVPVISTMRAAYRWCALTILIFWILTLLGCCTINKKIASSLLIIELLLFMPPLRSMSGGTTMRNWNIAFENGVVPLVGENVKSGEVVTFIPYFNDFYVNYLSALINFKTYNTGGDKNWEYARQAWPHDLKNLPMGKYDSQVIRNLLKDNSTDVVIVPFFSAYPMYWPLPPSQYTNRDKIRESLRELQDTGEFTVVETPFFGIVRKAPSGHD